ncbi:MAG: outer membrane lipoprotein chaperone LolA [Gammaproteobacteria bacterium]|nr:outer membrane lipoprotein chaperone LolA [Gammaproteobacteria bacterium]MDT8371004.1 outer membrane lipoprotein chaperone LolA [Gammaproteobacteria bacterium]
MTVKNLLRSSLSVLMLVMPVALFAAESATEKLNVFVQTVVTFKANFKQTVIDQQGKVIEEARGVFVLERPGKFRWDYTSPYPQHIVADGTRIWFYDVDLEQVTVKSQQEALTDTPATLLSGEMLPQDKYSLTDIDSDDGLLWVQLVPKDAESNYQTVTLAFDDAGLRQMLMKDSFDQRTRLVFSQAKENLELETDEFKFVPPQGVDVVGDVQGN